MRRTRFSLYCLDDGDEYFGDVIADYFLPPTANSNPALLQRAAGAARHRSMSSVHGAASGFPPGTTKLRGCLRLAGRAMYFDPDDWQRPVYCFRFRDLTSHESNQTLALVAEDAAQKLVSGVTASIASAGSSTTGNTLVFRCDAVTTMLVNGEVSAHVTDTAPDRCHAVSFPFGSAGPVVDKITSLLYVAREADCGLARSKLLTQFLDFEERATPFRLSMLTSVDERIVAQHRSVRIEPLTQERGRMIVSDQRLYFKPTFPLSSTAMEVVQHEDIRRVETRRYRYQEVALEVATKEGATFYFRFQSREERDDVLRALSGMPRLDRLRVNSLDQMTSTWQSGELSTFDYLMFLNWSSGRSFSDITQYPVMPWVLTDYTSDCIDLRDPAVYRDFSKPVGALNPSRLKGFIDRANELRSLGDVPYLYGSHFSTPAYVAYFLVREHPEYLLVLHSGKLDHGSRMFESIHETFRSVLNGPTDLKELVPKFFFGDGQFLRPPTSKALDLGVKQDGSRVKREVALPPWAHGDPREFIRVHRAALEGEVASRFIHLWIDLVFGFRQDGSEAWAANNVFHPYSYESSLQSLVRAEDETKRVAIETHIKEFGQMPRKLFFAPHPPRRSASTNPEVIRLDRISPPDSEELEQQRSSQFAKSLAQLSGDCTTPGNSERGGARVSEYLCQQMAENLAAASDAQQSPLCSNFVEASAPQGSAQGHDSGLPNLRSLAEVEQLVTETLNLAHILQARDGPLADELPVGANDKDESNPQSSSAEHADFFTLSLGPVVRCTNRSAIEAIVMCEIPKDADWLFDDYEDAVANVPLALVGDASGALHIVDCLHGRRLRTLSEFSNACIGGLLRVPASSTVLIGSHSGSIYEFDVLACAIREEHEDVCNGCGVVGLFASPDKLCAIGKDGTVACWEMHRADDDNDAIHINTRQHLVEIDQPTKATRGAIDRRGKRLASLHTDTVVVTSIDSHDHISFNLPPMSSRGVALLAFVRDHLIVVVSQCDVSTFALDGSLWGTFPAPCEVACAAFGCGGCVPSDALILVSPEGAVRAVSSTSGAAIAAGSIETVLNGARATHIAVGSECIALGDSTGRVHILTTLQP